MNAYPVLKNEVFEEINAKPVLKWAGGKGMLLPKITEHLPTKLKFGAIKRYIEPFIGGGAVFFDIANNYNFEDAYLFDINPELVILYNVIKYDVDDLITELFELQHRYNISEDKTNFYYAVRDEYNLFDKQIDANNYTKDFVRRAALTVCLNRTCFNGLYRVNSKGLFNVPVGKYKNPRILDEDNLREVAKALQYATIIQTDFAKVLNYVNKDSFVYYDPPYRPINASSFNSYAVGDFDDNEQKRLQCVFVKADKVGALQMLSNSDPTNYNPDDNFFDDLYAKYNIHRIWAKRMINSNPNGRDGVRELLITNY
ncbi:MAG: DNA adenine methylase [Alphaproteobacteria bacterium]|nr:DNA adenine methylase [Alphaproteobacteria bacterium]